MIDNPSMFFLIFNLSNHIPFADSLMVFATEYLIYITIFLMFVSAFKGKVQERKALILASLAIPVAVLLIKTIHIFVNEPRPFITYNFLPLTDNTPDASFPSRHATLMAVFTLPFLYYKSKWSTLFLLLLLWVGISRVYVGVHYPLDILGGIFTAILSLIISKQIIKFLKLKFSLK